MERAVRFAGAIVEQQALLDGTRELTIEAREVDAAAGPSWELTLTVRLPKEAGPEEGDLTLSHPDGREMYATLTSGIAATMIDPDTDNEQVQIDLEFAIEPEQPDRRDQTGAVRLTGTLTGDDARLVAAFVGQHGLG